MNDYLKVLLGAVGGAVLELLLVAAFRGGTGYGMMGPMMGGGLFGALFALLLLALLAALLVASIVYILTTMRGR